MQANLLTITSCGDGGHKFNPVSCGKDVASLTLPFFRNEDAGLTFDPNIVWGWDITGFDPVRLLACTERSLLNFASGRPSPGLERIARTVGPFSGASTIPPSQAAQQVSVGRNCSGSNPVPHSGLGFRLYVKLSN